MILVERTFPVAATGERVIGYLRDFTRTEEWDDGTRSCTRLGDPDLPIAVGTRFTNVSRFAGRDTELEYVLVVDEPDRVRFEGANATAVTADDIRVSTPGEPGDGGPGCLVHYRAECSFTGAARLLEPVLRLVFGRLADRTEERLRGVLDAL